MERTRRKEIDTAVDSESKRKNLPHVFGPERFRTSADLSYTEFIQFFGIDIYKDRFTQNNKRTSNLTLISGIWEAYKNYPHKTFDIHCDESNLLSTEYGNFLSLIYEDQDIVESCNPVIVGAGSFIACGDTGRSLGDLDILIEGNAIQFIVFVLEKYSFSNDILVEWNGSHSFHIWINDLVIDVFLDPDRYRYLLRMRNNFPILGDKLSIQHPALSLVTSVRLFLDDGYSISRKRKLTQDLDYLMMVGN